MNKSQPFLTANRYANEYERCKKSGYLFGNLPEGSGFLKSGEIICLPQEKGDSRYVYGKNGFNFWCNASGYMQANEGTLSYFLKSNEGREPKIAFFASFIDEKQNAQIIPLLGIPESCDNATRFTVFNKNYATYITKHQKVLFAVRTFVTKDNKISFTITAENKSDIDVQIHISAFINPHMLHNSNENFESRWFREARVFNAKANNLPTFVVRCNENISRTKQLRNFAVMLRQTETFGNSKIIYDEQTTSRLGYVGSARSSVFMPKTLKTGHFTPAQNITAFTDVGIFGDIIKWNIPSKSGIRQDYMLNFYAYKEWQDAPEEVYNVELRGERVDDCLSNLIKDDTNKNFSFNFAKTNGEPFSANSFNAFLDHVKTQVEFCALIKGYTQGSGTLVGVRDVSQALEAYLMWEPKIASEKLLEVLSYLDESGRFPRQYSLPAHAGGIPEMDLRLFIDQGVWVISTIITYLRFTDDFSFLDKECLYIRIIDEANTIEYTNKKDSVLNHIIKVMDWLLDQIDERTNCIKTLFGDWNDALDGLGVSLDGSAEFGTGVSVMATTQVWQNLSEMSELLSKIDAKKFSEKIRHYDLFARKIEDGLRKFAIVENDNQCRKICHGWGDKGKYIVGGFNDPDGVSRTSLTSHAFWALSLLYKNQTNLHDMLIENILSLDSPYGLKTFDPGFEPDATGVGRIPQLPIGTAENAAVYIHASLFGIMALFELGDYMNAWKQLEKVLPFTHKNTSISPFIMPNSYGLNLEKNIAGQSMNDWQTGSSNVLLKLLVFFVMGLRPTYDGIWLRPAEYCPFDNYTFEGEIKNTLFTFSYNKSSHEKSHLYVSDNEVHLTDSKIWDTKAYFISSDNLKGEIKIVYYSGKDTE